MAVKVNETLTLNLVVLNFISGIIMEIEHQMEKPAHIDTAGGGGGGGGGGSALLFQMDDVGPNMSRVAFISSNNFLSIPGATWPRFTLGGAC